MPINTFGSNVRRWGERNAPCKGCPDRTMACHSQNDDGSYVCDRYGAFKAINDAERQARKEFVRQSDEVTAVLVNGRRKRK